ncbi:hypothetical protein OAT60_03995, partial [Luminiphilus sp.]|nr:hypothetical protein [Luminiphilus sp.]
MDIKISLCVDKKYGEWRFFAKQTLRLDHKVGATAPYPRAKTINTEVIHAKTSLCTAVKSWAYLVASRGVG